MPGTIQISVLELKGFPAESSPALLKVSLGKREYQTSDMNDFSFPLTTLRGDIIITLEDAEGNELAHLGIPAMSIVEKVSWDDIFPVDGGGGYLHLNLKFMLNQQEQTRIRAMREAALKEKQVSIAKALSARFTNLIDAASPSSSYGEEKVSASRTSSVQEVKNLDESVQAGSLSNPSVLHNIQEPDFRKEERSIPIEEIPGNDNDNIEKAGFDHSEQEAEMRSTKKIDTRSSIHRIPQKSVSSEKVSSKQEFPMSSNVASSSDSLNLKDDHQVSGDKTVNKVKIIANAFESGLDKVYVMPRGKKFLKVGDPKEEYEPTDSFEERDISTGLVSEVSKLENDRLNNEVSAENYVGDVESHATVRSDQSKSKLENEDANNKVSAESYVDDVESQATVRSDQSKSVVSDPRADDTFPEEKETSAANSNRSTTSETGTNPGTEQSPPSVVVIDPTVDDMNTEETQISTRYSDSDRSLTSEKKHYSVVSSNEEEKRRRDTYSNDKYNPSNDKSMSLEYREKISDILGDGIEFVQHETDEEKEKYIEESDETEEFIPESPSNDPWNGLVAQAVKIALVVGFGVLVFLTRQRQPRKTLKNEEGIKILKPIEYMNDDDVFEAEKWIDS